MPDYTFFPKQAKFDIMAIVKSPSTDSTISTAREIFPTKSVLRRTPPPPPSASTPPTQHVWRTQAITSASPSSPCTVVSPQEDMWMIQRCDAFDEDDDDN
jgi:hypothetical protein